MKLKLAENLSLPLDFVTERIAYLARTGAGKSGGMRVEFEQFVDAGIFSIFVDPKGDAWGIRAEGKGPGKPVLVIGGDHGDIPLEPTGGKVIAEFLMRERVSCVIDISDFSTTEMWHFMAEFCKIAYKLNRDVCHLFIDEVDMLAGQQYFDPHCLHGIQLIQNKGRNRGWGVTIASQRPQMVNLTVLNASGTYIVMQTIGDDGLKVVRRLLGAVCSKQVTNEIIAQLPTLQTREAFVYSPQVLGIDPVRIKFAEFQTFDSMRTPKPGERRQAPKSLADIDLSTVQREMAETIEKVKSEDPKLLQAEIRRLKLELAKKPEAAAPAEPIEIEVPVFPDGLRQDLDAIFARLTKHGNQIGEIHTNLGETFEQLRLNHEDIRSLIDKYKDLPSSAVFGLPRSNNLPTPVRNSPPKSQPAMKSHSAVTNGDLSPLHRSILNGVALLHSIGEPNPTIAQVGAVIGKHHNAGRIRGGFNQLHEMGYAEIADLNIRLTGKGSSEAEIPDISSQADIHNLWYQRLKGNELEFLRVLINRYPREMSLSDLGAAIGKDINAGRIRGALNALVDKGLVTIDRDTAIASDLLFPQGLN